MYSLQLNFDTREEMLRAWAALSGERGPGLQLVVLLSRVITGVQIARWERAVWLERLVTPEQQRELEDRHERWFRETQGKRAPLAGQISFGGGVVGSDRNIDPSKLLPDSPVQYPSEVQLPDGTALDLDDEEAVRRWEGGK